MTVSTLVAMKAAPRWLLHQNKVPHYTNGKRRAGTLDSDSDIAQLATYEHACQSLKPGMGLGFALGQDTDGQFWQGIDLDKIELNGLAHIAPSLPGYTEVSPSGLGMHAIGKGQKIASLGSDGSGTEVYSSSRFFTVTEKVINDGELQDISKFVETVIVPLRKSSIAQIEADSQESLDGSTIDQLRNALKTLNADDYHTWITVGLALKTIGEPGRHLWLEWSSTSHKFNSSEAESKWQGFKPIGTNYKSVFTEAQKSGWVNPGYSQIVSLVNINLTNQFTNPVPRYKLLNAADLRNLPPLAWRVRGVLPAVGLAALYGPSASGKSFLALDMAVAIAEGESWFGCRVHQSLVLYLALEGEGGFKLRAAAWEAHTGRALPDGLRMVMQGFTLTAPQDVADLAAVIPAGTVVFIDTLNRAAPTADENSSKDMGEILQAAKALQAKTAGLVVLVHHTGKDATKGLRGHSSLFAALDAAVEVSRDGDKREWSVAKSKDGGDGYSRKFKLEIIKLGFDDYGDEITSCVVAPDISLQGMQGVKLPQGGNQRLVLEALRPMFITATTGKPGIALQKTCIELEVAITVASGHLTCEPFRRATRAREAITGLINRGVYGCNEGWLWLAQ